jgi:hypothetical protein
MMEPIRNHASIRILFPNSSSSSSFEDIFTLIRKAAAPENHLKEQVATGNWSSDS